MISCCCCFCYGSDYNLGPRWAIMRAPPTKMLTQSATTHKCRWSAPIKKKKTLKKKLWKCSRFCTCVRLCLCVGVKRTRRHDRNENGSEPNSHFCLSWQKQHTHTHTHIIHICNHVHTTKHSASNTNNNTVPRHTRTRRTHRVNGTDFLGVDDGCDSQLEDALAGAGDYWRSWRKGCWQKARRTRGKKRRMLNWSLDKQVKQSTYGSQVTQPERCYTQRSQPCTRTHTHTGSYLLFAAQQQPDISAKEMNSARAGENDTRMSAI